MCAIISDKSKLDTECKNEYENPLADVKDSLTELIWEYYRNGAAEFYINGEYGIPLWAGEIICSMKKYCDIRLNIVIPCEEQCRNWQEELRDRYYLVNCQSDYVSMAGFDADERGYEFADEVIIDSSDTVIIFGKNPKNTHAYSYAAENAKSVIAMTVKPNGHLILC